MPILKDRRPNDLLKRHPLHTGHQWCLLLVEPWERPTIMSAAVAGPTYPSDADLHQRYGT